MLIHTALCESPRG